VAGAVVIELTLVLFAAAAAKSVHFVVRYLGEVSRKLAVHKMLPLSACTKPRRISSIVGRKLSISGLS
jgi:hypothetical protein